MDITGFCTVHQVNCQHGFTFCWSTVHPNNIRRDPETCNLSFPAHPHKLKDAHTWTPFINLLYEQYAGCATSWIKTLITRRELLHILLVFLITVQQLLALCSTQKHNYSSLLYFSLHGEWIIQGFSVNTSIWGKKRKVILKLVDWNNHRLPLFLFANIRLVTSRHIHHNVFHINMEQHKICSSKIKPEILHSRGM